MVIWNAKVKRMLARRRYSLLDGARSARSFPFPVVPVLLLSRAVCPFSDACTYVRFPVPIPIPMPDVLFQFPMHYGHVHEPCLLVSALSASASRYNTTQHNTPFHSQPLGRDLSPHSPHALLLPDLILRWWRITKLEVLLPPVIGLGGFSSWSCESCERVFLTPRR